jgi:hypothetical protein
MLSQEVLTDCTQQARQQMQRILAVARQRGEAAVAGLKTPYRAVLHLPTTGVARAQQVQAALVAQLSTQTTRRVLQGAQVPAHEKLVSLFEPHTAIIRQGTPGKPTEFGRGRWLDEGDGGLISR